MPPAGTVTIASASNVLDSVNASTGSKGYRFTSLSRLAWDTDATSIDIRWWSSLSGLAAQAPLSVRVDGAHYATVTPSAYDALVLNTVSLPAGTKRLEVVMGPCSNIGAGAFDPYGSWVNEVRFNAGSTVTPVTSSPTGNRLILLGDSITCGFNATNPSSAAWPILVRDSFEGHVLVDAYGGRTLTESCDTGGKRTAILDSWEALGDVTHVAICLGTNDYGGSHATATDFGTTYGAMIDAIHARFASAQVIAFTPIPRTGETAPNAVGNTLPEYRTAISNLTSGRAWLTVLAGPSAVSSSDLAGDGLHLTTAAQSLMSTALLNVLA